MYINDCVKSILDLFFPIKCIGCGKYGIVLCQECANEIEKNHTDVCPKCGKISKFGSYCIGCKSNNNKFLNGLLIATIYDEGPTKELIHNLKYAGFLDIVPILGELIYLRVNKNNFENFIIVPVPLHKKREAIRGFNQSELIARYVSSKLNIPGGMALERTKNTCSQVGLSKSERVKNLAGAFVCTDNELVYGSNILLIDDVVTSGATLNECAKVLKENGARKIIGLVVAKRM